MAGRWALPLILVWLLLAFARGAFAQSFQSPFLTAEATAVQLSPRAPTAVPKTTPTPLPSPDIFTATIQSFPTSYDFLTTVSSAGGALSTSVFYYYPVTNFTPETVAFTINTENENVNNFCWYPVSGNYGLLPRLLFYVTIVAALILRHHQWLYAGALVAALTYSGAAAIHACLGIWRGPMYGDLDALALLAILSTSCIITVPLLNWSSTLRNIGSNLNEEQIAIQQEQTKPHTDIEFDVASRTILLYWGFLVMVGFLCVFVAVPVLEWNPDYPHSWLLANIGGVVNVTCSPPGGILDLSAGQGAGFDELYLTTEFISVNNCIDPCTSVTFPAIFRSDSDLTTISEAQTNGLLMGALTEGEIYDGSEGVKTRKQEKTSHFVTDYLKWGIMSLPYVLAEGLWAAMFGRRTPAQVRNLLYAFLTRVRLSRSPLHPAGPLQRTCAMLIALMGYSWAVLILIVSVPLFVANITALELFLAEVPQSESANHVGAWSPWASVGLALFAGFFARYHGDIEYLTLLSIYKVVWLAAHPSWPFLQLCSRTGSGEVLATNIFSGDSEAMPDRHLYRTASKSVWARTFRKFSRYCWSKVGGVTHGISCEWDQLVQFCRDPEFSRGNQGRVHRLNVKPCGCTIVCQCPLSRVQGDCRHEEECKPNKVCQHDPKCRHSHHCQRARRLMLLNPERMAIPMALTAIHGQKFQLDMTRNPIPIHEEGQPIEHPTFLHPAGSNVEATAYDPGHAPSDAPDHSGAIGLPHWHQSPMPVQPPRMLLSRFWKRSPTYDHVQSEKEAWGESDDYKTRPKLVPSHGNSWETDENSQMEQSNVRVVSEQQIHPLLRSVSRSNHPRDEPERSRRGRVSNLSVEESRRLSMQRPLPPVPPNPGFVPQTPYTMSKPNMYTRWSASAASAVSPISPSTQRGATFDNLGQGVSPQNSNTPAKGPSPEEGPSPAKGSSPQREASSRDRYRKDNRGVREAETSRPRNSTGLTSSFEEGIMQREGRSRAYAPEPSPNWHARPQLTKSSSAPIPVHTEEEYEGNDAADTFSNGQTPSDFAGSMPPTHFLEKTDSEESSATADTPRASPRRSFTSSNPHPPSVQLSPDDPSAEPIVPSGEFLSPVERHYLLDPPSGASTPPIQLPPLSPADPTSNTARAGNRSLLMRSPHLSLGSAMETPDRVMSLASRMSGVGTVPQAGTFGSTAPDSLGGSITTARDGGTSVAEMGAEPVREPRLEPEPETPVGRPSIGQRSTVSYLQVQRPSTTEFAEEITLRKDENGVYRLVTNGHDAI